MRIKSSLFAVAALLVPGTAFASEGGESGGLLTVDGGLMFWTLLVFCLLLYILKRTAWPVILDAVAERERSLQATLDEAARLNAEAKALLAEQNKLLGDARAQAASILAETKQVAERERAQATEKARAEAEELLARARREIGAEKDRAKDELRREAVDIALAAAGKLIEQKLDAEADRKMVVSFLTSLEKRK